MKKLLALITLLASSQSFGALDEVLMFNGKIYFPEEKAFRNTNQMELHVGKKEIVITIDDGPTPNVTQAVLQVLRDYNVRATFFSVTSNVAKYPSLMHEIQADGHIVGNHSKTHANLTQLGSNWQTRLYDEVIGSYFTLKPFAHFSKKSYFRAPGGNWNPTIAAYLNTDPIGQKYTGPVLWDVGGVLERDASNRPTRGADWACWSNKWTVDECLEGYINETKAYKGGVVLFHDLRMQSAELIRKYIQWAQDNDYKIVSLDEVRFK